MVLNTNVHQASWCSEDDCRFYAKAPIRGDKFGRLKGSRAVKFTMFDVINKSQFNTKSLKYAFIVDLMT